MDMTTMAATKGIKILEYKEITMEGCNHSTEDRLFMAEAKLPMGVAKLPMRLERLPSL